MSTCLLNSLRLRQDGHHFPDDDFKCNFLNENAWISIKISLNPALIQIMAWRRPGDKPLSEPMMVKLPTHICVTRPEWVKCSYTVTWSNSRLVCKCVASPLMWHLYDHDDGHIGLRHAATNFSITQLHCIDMTVNYGTSDKSPMLGPEIAWTLHGTQNL